MVGGSRRRFLQAPLLLLAPRVSLAAEAFDWDRLRKGGLVLLMRHASTVPGLGDPPQFRVGDCATQRNLSEAGRDEARGVGRRLAAERVPIGPVYTSPWCRCRETAQLAFGRSEDWEPLSSFFDHPERADDYTRSVRRRISGYGRRPAAGNVVMVTHNVNIAALTRLSVGTGEVVAVRPDGCCDLRVVQTLKPLI